MTASHTACQDGGSHLRITQLARAWLGAWWRVLLPVGAVKVWVIEEVPFVGLAEPSIAAYWPLCGLVVVTEQAAACPLQLQPVRAPVSKPPLVMALAPAVTLRV